MDRKPEDDREHHLAWVAARLGVPAERVAATDVWRSYPGPGDSLDLIELLFVLETELNIPEGGRP